MGARQRTAYVADARSLSNQRQSEGRSTMKKTCGLYWIVVVLLVGCHRPMDNGQDYEPGTKVAVAARSEPRFLSHEGTMFRSLCVYEEFQGQGRTITANYDTKLDLYHELPALAAEAQHVFSEGVQQEADRVGARYAIVSPNVKDSKEGRVVTGFAFERDASGTWSKVVVPGKARQ